MASTVTQKDTLKSVLDRANLNQLADALALAKLGTMLTPIDQTITLSAVSASVDLSALGAKLPALIIQSVRVTDVTGGSGSAGVFAVGDASATPSAASAGKNGLCSLSADGKTLTFEGTVKAIRVVYIPRTDLSTVFPTG